jgi:hypothetical protein
MTCHITHLAELEDVLLPVHNFEASLLGDGADVTSVEPAVSIKHLGSLLRLQQSSEECTNQYS